MLYHLSLLLQSIKEVLVGFPFELPLKPDEFAKKSKRNNVALTAIKINNDNLKFYKGANQVI